MYERYIMNDRDLDKALSTLNKSEVARESEILRVGHILMHEGLEPFKRDKELQKVLRDVRASYKETAQCVTVREALMIIDSPTSTEKEREDAMKTIRAPSKKEFERFTKPTNMKKVVKQDPSHLPEENK